MKLDAAGAMLGVIAARKIGPSLSDRSDREWNLGAEQTRSTGYEHAPRNTRSWIRSRALSQWRIQEQEIENRAKTEQ